MYPLLTLCEPGWLSDVYNASMKKPTFVVEEMKKFEMINDTS
jgi:hypothetical protein